MNKNKLQELLSSFVQDDQTIYVELHLQYLNDDNSVETYLPASDEKKVTPALQKLVTKQLNSRFFSKNEDYDYEVVSAHSSEANTVRQVFHVPKSKIPRAEAIFGDISNNKSKDLPNNFGLEDVWSYIFKVESNGKTIYLFKRSYAVSLLRKENSYALFFSNSKLTVFDKDLLRLSTHFDVMLVENELIILNRNEFEKAFDYVDAMQNAAEINVDFIKKSKLVDGIDKISELSKNKTTLKKLLNINPKSKVLQKSPKQIVSLAKKYKVKFDLSTDETKVSITTKKSAIAFVELLNDDYLKSEFSDELYKTKGKARI